MSDPEYWDDRRLERRFAAVLVVPEIGVTIIAMIVFAVTFRVLAHDSICFVVLTLHPIEICCRRQCIRVREKCICCSGSLGFGASKQERGG